MRVFATLSVLSVLSGCGGQSGSTNDAGINGDGGGSGDAGVTDSSLVDIVITNDATAMTLSQAGLYSNIANKTIATGYLEFSPSYPLWSDSASKRRWMYLPPGTQINTADINHWQFPIGARFFKEFSLGGKRIETRLIEKRGEDDFWMGAFLWRQDESDADFVSTAQTNVLGTMHDVPSQTQCETCHRGEPGRILGFSAIQLLGSENGDTSLVVLVNQNRLSHPPSNLTARAVPGDTQTRLALGFLHGNCGHCHNPTTSTFASINMELYVHVGDATPQATPIYQTTVSRPLTMWRVGVDPWMFRIKPGDPDLSGLYYRSTQRGNTNQMPPRPFTEELPMPELSALRSWISGLPSQ